MLAVRCWWLVPGILLFEVCLLLSFILDARFSILDDILTGPKIQIIEYRVSNIEHQVSSILAPIVQFL